MLKSDQSSLVDLSFCDVSTLRITECIQQIGAKNIRALSLRNISIDTGYLIADLNKITSLWVLNISGMTCQSRIRIGELFLQDLQFLNISKLRLTDDVVNLQGCPSLLELICHSNKLTSLKMFAHLNSLQLLDVENNCIQAYSMPRNLKVLNIKGNSDAIPQSHLEGLIMNPVDGVVAISLFQKLSELAFGDGCELRAAQRIIKVNSSVQFRTQDAGPKHIITSPSSLFLDNTNNVPNLLSPQPKLLTPATTRRKESVTDSHS